MHPALRKLFDEIDEAVVVVTEDGRIRFANAAACALAPSLQHGTLPDPRIASVLKLAIEGRLQLPYQSPIDLHHTDPLRASVQSNLMVTLFDSPVQGEWVLLIKDDSAQRLYRNFIDNLQVLADETLPQSLETFTRDIGQLLEDLESLVTQPVSDNGEEHRLHSAIERGRVASSHLQQHLHKLLLLLAGTAAESVSDSTALDFEPLLLEVLARHAPAAKARGISLQHEPAANFTGRVYANRTWLLRAVSECIENAVVHGRARRPIKLTLAQRDTFLLLSITNEGTYDLDRKAQPTAVPSQTPNPGAAPLGIGLTSARQVIEHLGGHVTMRQTIDGFVTCLIELPTGGDARESARLTQAQLDRFAADLSRLMTQGHRARDAYASLDNRS